MRTAVPGVLALVLLAGCGGDESAVLPATPVADGSLTQPQGLAFDAEGTLYVSDCSGGVFAVSEDGALAMVAGSLTSAQGDPTAEQAEATARVLDCPDGLAFDDDGNLYVAEHYGNRVLRVDADGIMTTVAGKGPPGHEQAGFGGDDGHATDALVSSPTALAFDADGKLYVTTHDKHRVRVVGTDGVITTFAGNGEEGYTGDGGPAAEASLSNPWCVHVAEGGTVYLCDYGNGVRRVEDGTISTTAGKPDVEQPTHLALGADGTIYVTESVRARVLRIGESGDVEVVAGSGEFGTEGEGGAATGAQLVQPWGIALDDEGNLYVADKGSARVLKVVAETGVLTKVVGGQ